MHASPTVPRALLLASSLAAAAVAAGPRGLRWEPPRQLALDGAVALTLTGHARALAADLQQARAHLRLVRSGELVPLEAMTQDDVDADGNPVLIFYPLEELRPRSVYVFETRGPSLGIERVFQAGSSGSPRLNPGPPRFRHLGHGRFTCGDLDLALRVEAEVEHNAEAAPAHEEDDLPGAWEGTWEAEGTYLLAPDRGRGSDSVDLGPLLTAREGAYRVRFRLIGWDAFRGRPSRWVVLPPRTH